MSSIPDSVPKSDALLRRAMRYVDRAKALSEDPALTQIQAVEALRHLHRMQRDLGRARLAQFRALERAMGAAGRVLEETEAEMKTVRSALSEALLHATPRSDSDQTLGLVPHGPAASGDIASRPASISRAFVDLEALRPFFSADALEQAVARRAKETQLCDVVGVTYANLPHTAALDCMVL